MLKTMTTMYPFWACLISIVIAQMFKPFGYYHKYHKWDWHTIYASGGFPSSHTAGVTALCLACGIQERFDSALFAVALGFSLIVIYDAANVRFYTGQNIKITQQLIHDIQEEVGMKLDNPIYLAKVKDVLGHKWIEVLGGCGLGIIIALIGMWIGGFAG